MRAPAARRSLKQAIEERTEPVSRTEVLEDQPHIQALEQFLPQIAAESAQAAKTARVVFRFFRKKRIGRRCSCFTTESSPDGFCQICYASGYVGGWDQHGCRTDTIDVTYGDLRLVNIRANYDTRPATFVLEDGAKLGFIETELPIVRNIQQVDLIHWITGGLRPQNDVKIFVRTPTETSFVELTELTLAPRLTQSKLVFRVQLSRSNTNYPSPKFSHLMVRYKLIPEVSMFGDMPLSEESFELGELGFTDSFTMITIFVPHNFDYIGNEDFLIRMSDQKRFKVVRYKRNAVSEVLLSHEVNARLLIPGTDSLVNFP